MKQFEARRQKDKEMRGGGLMKQFEARRQRDKEIGAR
jgi:hypothetical protein